MFFFLSLVIAAIFIHQGSPGLIAWPNLFTIYHQSIRLFLYLLVMRSIWLLQLKMEVSRLLTHHFFPPHSGFCEEVSTNTNHLENCIFFLQRTAKKHEKNKKRSYDHGIWRFFRLLFHPVSQTQIYNKTLRTRTRSTCRLVTLKSWGIIALIYFSRGSHRFPLLLRASLRHSTSAWSCVSGLGFLFTRKSGEGDRAWMDGVD
ncbi:hypothetical protein QBC35DRAFT_295796 [Podospora australis]|uniref:Secreted protein n=1 Tax=Podospora australis TaxID=1536484 RepID=A0AAN6X130_9PEZI|nr:hypothetical protein QBC35DRAFT_295796 [Podospora australis]